MRRPKLALGILAVFCAGPAAADTIVTEDNFVRAETDHHFARAVAMGSFGELQHQRQMISVERQGVVRMNRDTLYAAGVFDLEASPVTVSLPDSGRRFMSLQAISEDHYSGDTVYAPGRYTFTKDQIGTRYVEILVRTLADPGDQHDMEQANALQDAIKVEQASIGRFEVPDWDAASREAVRDMLVARAGGFDTGDRTGGGAMFGTKDEVDPALHLIGAAVGWGGNPRKAAIYRSVTPKENDGTIVYRLTVGKVPVDGFWSVSVYNAKGFFEPNTLGLYSLNNITAKPSADGSITIQFGGCGDGVPNCLPIMPGWNYTVRLYRPRPEILDGSWKFPEAQPAS